MTARILATEDNPVQAKILGLQLKDFYDLRIVDTGEAALEILATEQFDIILMDVNLPGMSGYEACRRIKAEQAHASVPVLFISAGSDMEDRLQGFEAGGFDYLAKPVAREELLKKIAIVLEYQDERRQLKDSADFAVSTAMTAMTSAAEQGLVLQFMQASFDCKVHRDLADSILATTTQFGLDAMVQIRSRYEKISRSSAGPCTPLEVSMLDNIREGGRIVDLRQRSAINFERVSLVVKNMPTAEPERYGRLKDHLSMLMEGADARSKALDVDMFLAAEAKRLIDAVHSISESLIKVNQKTHELHAAYGRVFNSLAGELETNIPLLELNHSQEMMLDDLLRSASAAYVSLSSQETQVDQELLDAMESLQRLAPPANG